MLREIFKDIADRKSAYQSGLLHGLEQVRDRPQMEAVAEFDLIALWNLPVKLFLARAPMTAQLHRK
jgi:hypothetical protein